MTPVTPVLPTDTLNLPEIVFAKDQPEYLPLPAVVTGDGCVTTRWRLTWSERMRVLIFGDLWLQQYSFGAPLQPQRPSVTEPLFEAAE